jgi:hypothetical protein
MGEKIIEPVGLDQVTGPEKDIKLAGQPTQPCVGPVIFNTGLKTIFLTLLPLQFGLIGFW